jgi:hypothetical protein
MFESVFAKIAETFSDHRGQKSSWGRWAGSVIIATILFVWAFLCIKQLEWIDMGPYNSLAILGIFITLAYKSIQENKQSEIVVPPVQTDKTKRNEAVIAQLQTYGMGDEFIDEVVETINSFDKT